jgi:hypothetical protein
VKEVDGEMIRITVELLPFGLEQNKQHLGTAEIWNDASGSRTTGNYKFCLSKRGNPRAVWKSGSVSGFRRLQLGVWDLLYLCLRSALEGRNE